MQVHFLVMNEGADLKMDNRIIFKELRKKMDNQKIFKEFPKKYLAYKNN